MRTKAGKISGLVSVVVAIGYPVEIDRMPCSVAVHAGKVDLIVQVFGNPECWPVAFGALSHLIPSTPVSRIR